MSTARKVLMIIAFVLSIISLVIFGLMAIQFLTCLSDPEKIQKICNRSYLQNIRSHLIDF